MARGNPARPVEAPGSRTTSRREVEKRGWKGRVRVSHSGCMGLCAKGPNVMLYPQGLWFSAVTLQDADAILAKAAELIG